MNVLSPILENKISHLKRLIEEKVFIKRDQRTITDVHSNDVAWIADFRRIILQGETLSVISDVFLEKIKESGLEDFQVCGLESAAIPLVAGVVMKSAEKGKNVNGFFIRKSRKKSGLTQMVEGTVGEENVVIVDDLINTGSSVLKQVAALEGLGKKVVCVCVVLRFKDNAEYLTLKEKGIKIISIFSLEEFPYDLRDVISSPFLSKQNKVRDLSVNWQFSSPDARYEQVIPKSSPSLYDGRLYFGSDNGTFWCLDSKDGSVLWKRIILHGAKHKRIFSSPVVSNGVVYFGGYDGNFYALDCYTGVPKWVAFDADWIGSSPCVSDDLGIVYVGMEFGFWKKKGGVAAYKADKGELLWQFSSSEYTHGSPTYSKKHKIVICGSNDGVVYGLSAKSGQLLWSYNTGGEVKGGCSISPNQNYVAVGSFNYQYVILDVKTGRVLSILKTLEGNYSTPSWLNDEVIICASLDKCIYAYNFILEKVVWKFSTTGRVFASPLIHNNHVYVGSNDGFLYVINSETGELVSQYPVVERITNKVIVDPKEAVIYIPTQANEIIKAKLPS